MSDAHFKHLFDAYHTIGREIPRIEQEVETVSDAYAETLRKKRLKLKDELFWAPEKRGSLSCPF